MAKANSKKFGLTTQVLLALILGALVGAALNSFGYSETVDKFVVSGLFDTLGKIFFSLLQFLVVPVVLVSLTCGAASLDDIRKMGRVGGKIVSLYMLTTALAITVALGLAEIFDPGVGFNLETQSTFQAKEAPALSQVITDIAPSNLFKSLVEANMLQIIVASILLGLSITLAGSAGKRLLAVLNDLNDVLMKLVHLVMSFAPIGVFGLMAKVFATQGFSAFAPLASYMLVVVAALLFHASVNYMLILKLLGRLSPVQFFKNFKEVILFAFSTSSSNATLPVTLEVVEEKMGVDKKIAAFTLPLGATINMDGTAIMQGVATVFIAQAYGINIGLEGYLTVIFMATLASIGTAGVPSVGLVMLTMVLRQVNLPVEGVGIILGVDRLLDMSRTVVNVMGDAAMTCVVAKSEGMLDEKQFNA